MNWQDTQDEEHCEIEIEYPDLLFTKKDDLVFLKGALIEIQSSDGWRWRSSLSREDTGAGACELMRVDQIIWREQ